jgi:O-antigen/teichoic acid export membrane protein
MNIAADYGSAVTLIAWTMAFDALAIIPFASLRLERKAKTFAALKFANIIINVALNFVLLLKFKMGVEGIFISGLVASLSTFILLLPTISRHFTSGSAKGLLRALLKFGLPYIPAGLAAMAIQVIDRPIMRALTDDTTVGIYQANYKLGIFMMLVVSMFDFAWRPFYFSMSNDPDAKPVFARVLTYMMLVMAAFFLIISLFIRDIVTFEIFGRHFIAPDYWSGLGVVPVVLLGYVFLGASNNLSAGIFIEKKTYLIPFVTGIGAVVNIVANYLLIPRIGMMGGAWATFLAYFIMAGAMYAVAQRIYPIRYEYGRILKMALVTAGIFFADYYFGSMGGILLKFGLLVLFLALMYFMKFFNEAEIVLLTNMLRRKKAAAEIVPTTDLEV